MKVDDLIKEMKAVKAKNTGLEVSDVLKIFEIKAMIDHNNILRRKM